MGFWQKFDRFGVKTMGRFSGLLRFAVRFLPSASRGGDAIPFHPLEKRLPECVVGLVTTCGIHLPSQEPFDMDERMGDPSYREFSWEDIRRGYRVSHSHIDPKNILADINTALPGDRVRELAARGIVKGLHPVLFSFMGYIPRTRPLAARYAPEVAAKLKEGGVDIAVLTPC